MLAAEASESRRLLLRLFLFHFEFYSNLYKETIYRVNHNL